MQNKYFHKYLKVAPFSLALWRGVEAQKLVKSYKSLERPMLDLGCGFGEFAGVFFERQIEVGIDINIEDLIRAKKMNKYKQLLMADARNMPFPKNKFSTVISISTLEHIPHPEFAIREVYRVLKPSGIFIYTVPTNDLNNDLFYPELFKLIGLQRLSTFYISNFHKIFKHVNIFSVKKWHTITQKVGFRIIKSQGTFSKNLMRVFDLFLITALPSQISRWMFNSRWIWGLPLKQMILDRIFNKLMQDERITNSNILVIAQKI